MTEARRVRVIYAGGTIGMVPGPDGFVPAPDLPARISAAVAAAGRATPPFSFSGSLTPIDSAEAVPADWFRIAEAVRAALAEAEGVVVLHGTDTLAHAAASLTLQLGRPGGSVVVTGAQIPFGIDGSDALANVLDALDAAADPRLDGVSVAFGGLLLSGARVTKRSSRAFDAFASPNAPVLGHRGADGRLEIQPPPLHPRTAPELRPVAAPPGRVLSLRITPGLPAAAFSALASLQPAAILVECYGLGTAPTADGTLTDAIARATEAGIVVALVSQCAHGGVSLGTYAAGAPLVTAGALSAGDMSFEMAFVKLTHLAALGLAPDAIGRAFTANLAGERTPD
ncbi:asparaginase [Segnochrobactraceae bacterium EtOH-i3]